MKIKGIDISYCQRDIDYAKAKANGVKFAIIRSGYHEKTDDMLYTHLAGCKKAGIDVGIYVYAMARTTAEAVKEARHCLNSIADHEATYPIYYDLEDDRLLVGLTNKQRTDNALAFINEVKRQGYLSGIYANPAWLENHLEYDRLKGIELWLAAWTENPDKATKYVYGQQMWQWGLDKVSGIGIVDGNLCYVDYPTIIKNKGLNIGNSSVSKVVPEAAGSAEFRACNKKYRCIAGAANMRKLASTHSAIIGKFVKDTVYDVVCEIFEDGKLRFLQFTDGAFGMYVDQVGDRLFEEVTGNVSGSAEFKVGDKVKVKSGCKAYDGSALAPFVFGANFYVMEVGTKDKDRVCIGDGKEFTAAVRCGDLIRV